jgi:SAM-dependent MidA family methyltransferase
MGGTPVKPVSGFEIDDDSESVAERTRSAQEIYDAVKDLFNMYVHRPEEYKRLLAALASFNPDWGERLDQYDNAYTEAVNEKRRQAGLPAVGKKPAETGIGQISADSARELAKIKLRQLIESKGGRITYAEFMENVLFNRDYGYYGAGVVQFGGKISDSVSFGTDSLNPRFAEGMAKQFYNMWESMDKPTVFDLVEMGAGDGTLCLNVLNEIQSKMPDLYGAVRYTIVEVSSSLIKRQSEKISAVHKNVIWKLHSANEEMFKEGELTGVVFSNELVDEFTAHRVVYDEKTNKLQEIYVGFDLARGGFYEVKGDITDRGVIEYMQTIYDETGRHPEPGVEVAVCPQMKDWARNTAKALNKGYIVTFDYGYFYWEGEGQLLTARGLSVYNKGNPVNALLFASDLTHYVDFRMLGVYGEENGLHTEFAGNTSNYMSGFVPGFSSPYGTDVLIQSKGVFSGAVVGILERLKGKIEKSALPNMSLEGDMDVNRVIDDMIAIARKSDKNAEEVLFNVLAKGDNLEQKITQVISEAGLDNSIVKHSLDSVIWKAGKVRQTEEMASGLLAGAPVKGLDVGVIDAHALVGMREDELRRVIGVLTSDVNKALAVVVFDNEDEAVANALTGFNVTIVRANEIGEMLPEEAAVDKVKRERFAGQDIEISNVSVLASLENIVKGRWRVALSRFHYIVLNNKSLTNTALLNMYKELPADIKGYLARTGLSVETIQRATLQEEKFEPEKYDQTAIIEIGKAA